MSCGSNSRNRNSCYQKSCQRYYSTTRQELTTTERVQLIIAGAKVVDTGISIDTQPQSYEILKAGLYHISGDLVLDGTVAGNVTLSAYLDGVQLPCTIRRAYIVADGAREIHTETDLDFRSCCCNGDVNHTITFALESDGTATATVAEFCSGVIKEA